MGASVSKEHLQDGRRFAGARGCAQNLEWGDGRGWSMKRISAAVAVVLCASAGAVAAAGNASKDDAVAMVKKGVPFNKANGTGKGYAEIPSKIGPFRDRDLYLVVYGMDGVVYAHGANERMVGRNLIDLRDIDGKPFVQERVDLAKTKGVFWQDYKFTNPITKKPEPKQMYCERLEATVVCGGINGK